MNKRNLAILMIMIMLFACVVYALGSVTLTTPSDDVYNADDNELTFVCNGTEQMHYNITSIDLYTNTGGTWSIAYTDTTNADNNSAKGLSYTHYALTYGEHLVWNCRVNYTHAKAADGEINASTYASSNKSVRVSYIGTSTLTSPADNYYPLNDTITHICNGTAVSDYNITSITLWTNSTGTWTSDHLKTITTPVNNTAVGNVSIISGISDGTTYLWNCMINYTKTESIGTINQSLTYSTANRTVFVEYPPVITLNYPSNSGYVSGTDMFNFTSVDAYGDDGDNYTNCIVYTNLSTWTTYGPTIKAENNTQKTTTLALSDNTYTWNVKCWEPDNSNIYGFSNSNYTFTIDTTNPTISTTFVNETWSNSANNTINYTLTDTNAKACDLWLNVTGSALYINSTNTSINNGAFDLITQDYADGNYTFYLSCNDSAGNWVNSSQYELRVDTQYPAEATIANNSRNGYCDQWNITISSDEPVNATLDYGTTSAKGSFLYETDLSTIQEFSVPSQLENTAYYFNVTICDVAGNCNETTNYDYTFPFKVCTGWTYLGIYESEINFSEITGQSGANYVYSWNETNQEWFYYLGSGTGGNQKVKYGDAVMLYEATNSTWSQNRSGTGYYNYNISSGDNYISLTTSYTFGGLSTALMNATDSWGVGVTQLNGTAINFTWFDAWNNTALDWIGGYTYDVAYNWSWNNNTNLGNATGTEVVWFYSAYNSTDYGSGSGMWNGTSLTWYNGSEWK